MTREQHDGYELIYIELPAAVHGTVTELNGRPVVIINSALDPAEQARTIRHELAHLRGGHLRSCRPVQDLEAEAKAAEQAPL